jgi:two-component system, sensor histidine kinase LadS
MTFLTPWTRRLLLAALGLLALSALAQDSASSPSPAAIAAIAVQKHITLPLEPARLDIGNRFYAASDASTTQTVAEMSQAEFKPLKGVFVAGYSAKAHWLRFTISDPAERVREWWLELEPPFIDQVDLYESLGNDAAGKAQFRQVKTGDMTPFSTREVPNQSFVFQLSPKAQPTTYYVRLQSSGPIWTGARLWHSTVFAGYSVRYAHIQSAAFGAFLLLMLITLVQGIVFKDPVYLAFVAHVGAVLVAQASIIFPLHLPDNWFRLVDILPTAATCFSVATYAVFCNYFVLSVQKSRVYSWLFMALTVVGVASALACISPSMRWIVPGILAIKIAGSVLPVIAVSRRLTRGSWYDRLVWLGIVMYVPAQALLLWRLASTSEQGAFWNTLHIYTGVLLTHMVLITFALGERISRITRASQELQGQLSTERKLKDLADKTAFDQRSFLAMVAHELRGPLAVTRSAAYNLSQMVTPQTEAVLTRIERMDTGLQQMASLIAVCLTHEREGFAQPLSLNLHLTAAQLRLRLEPFLDRAIAARVRWPDEDADASSTHRPITGNPALLTIAVRNMLENAARCDTSGAVIDVAWEVEPGMKGKPDAWRISVLDRGPGIPTERMEHIFEPFVRGTDADNGGLGLGLYIIKRIASMHGATAAARLRDGGGTVVSIGQGYESNRPAAQ